MSFLSFLKERECGSFTSYQYRHGVQVVKTRLEELASTPSLNQPCEFSGEPRATFLVDFNPNRTKMASTHGDHTVRVTDIVTGKCTHILTGHPRTPWCVAFHPGSNDILASGCLGGEVRIWDLRGGGSEVWKSSNNAMIASLAFHPMDHVLVFATKNSIYFWDWSQPQPFACCRTSYEYERIRWLRFDTCGHYLFTGICNNTTMQSVRMSNIVHIGDEANAGGRLNFNANPVPNWQQMQSNRRRYQQLVRRFFHYQQERLRGGSRASGAAEVRDGETNEGERPTSPVHVDALNQARDYASFVTRNTHDGDLTGFNYFRPSRYEYGNYNLYGAVPPGTHSPPPRPGVHSPPPRPGAHSPPPRPGVHSPPPHSEVSCPNLRPSAFSSATGGHEAGGTEVSCPNLRPSAFSPTTGGHEAGGTEATHSRSRLQSLSAGTDSVLNAREVLAARVALTARNIRDAFTASNARDPLTVCATEGDVHRQDIVDRGALENTSAQALSSSVSESVANQDTAMSRNLFSDCPSTSVPCDNRDRLLREQASQQSGTLVALRLRNSLQQEPSGIVSSGQVASERFTDSDMQCLDTLTARTGLGEMAADHFSEDSVNRVASQASSDASILDQRTDSHCVPSGSSTGTRAPSLKRTYATAFGAAELETPTASSVIDNSASSFVMDNPASSSQLNTLSSSGARLYQSGNSDQRSDGVHWMPETEMALVSASSDARTRVETGNHQLTNSAASGTSSRISGLSLHRQSSQSGSDESSHRNPSSASLLHSRLFGTRESIGSSASSSVTTGTAHPTSPTRSRTSSAPPCSHEGQNSEGCPICGNFNMDLLRSRSLNSSAWRGAGAAGQHPWSSAHASASGRTSAASSSVPMLQVVSDLMSRVAVHSRNGTGIIGSQQERTQKTDGTSQTQGELHQPEHTDQGTDVCGLAPLWHRLDESEYEGSRDTEMEAVPIVSSEVQEDGSMQATISNSSEQKLTCTCAHNSPLNKVGAIAEHEVTNGNLTTPDNFLAAQVHCQRDDHNMSALPALSSALVSHISVENSHSATPTAAQTSLQTAELGSVPLLLSPMTSDSASSLQSSSSLVSGLTEHLEQQVSELDRRINVLRDTFNERMRMLHEDRQRLLSSLRVRVFQSGNAARTLSYTRCSSVPPYYSPPAVEESTTTPDFSAPRQSANLNYLPDFDSSQRPGSSSMLRHQLLRPDTSSSASHLGRSRLQPENVWNIPLETSGGPTVVFGTDSNSTGQSRTSLENSVMTGMGMTPESDRNSYTSEPSSSFVSGSSASSRGGRTIEVLGPSGESETISYRELARRMANREDVTVVGEHRLRQPASAVPPNTSDGEQSTVQHPLLETFLRRESHHRPASSHYRNVPTIRVDSATHDHRQPEGVSSSRRMMHEEHSWHALQQRHLHPHYSVSILDETINRPNDALQTAINRAIAGVFMSTGEQAVASNIVPQTHRIQRWDFRQCQLPDLTQSKSNIVVEHCKLHNDASIDLSHDASLLVTFVPSHRGFPDDNILAVFSLLPESFGQCLYTKSFGPNAISVSLSPENHYALVGLAAKRLSWIFSTSQLVGQIFQLKEQGAGELSMKHVTDLFHTCPNEQRSHVSVNSARWLPEVGDGIVYGTNRGDLHFCRVGAPKSPLFPEEEKTNAGSSGQRDTTVTSTLQTSSIAIQTGTGSIHRSAFTQTSEDEESNEGVSQSAVSS